MKFKNTRGLNFQEVLHYADLGLIEGFDEQLPADFISDVQLHLDEEYNRGLRDGWEN